MHRAGTHCKCLPLWVGGAKELLRLEALAGCSAHKGQNSRAQAYLCPGSLQVLAAFLKAIGCIIPLMDATYAEYYTKEVMLVLVREFQTPDEEMKKIVLKVVKQCVETEGVQPDYVRREILPEFFRSFWVRRMALDRRNYRALVETTVALANKVRADSPPRSCLMLCYGLHSAAQGI